MNRLRVRVSSAAAALVLTLAALHPAAAQEMGTPNFWFAGTRLIFERAIPLDGDVAVSVRDAGLTRFLAKLGATLAYQPQQRYIVITAADHRTITFTIGSAQYLAGGVSARAAFAPFIDSGEPIIPLEALAHALYVEPVAGAGETVLQPQIGAIDIRTQAGRTLLVVRGATALAYVKRVDTPTHVEFAFGGISSTLAGVKRLAPGINATISTGGTPRNPSTVIALDAPRGLTYELSPATSPYELALAVAPGEVSSATTAYGTPPAAYPAATAPPAAAQAPYIPPPPPALSGSGAATPAAASPYIDATPPAAYAAPTGPSIATVTMQPVSDGLTIHIALDGPAAYDWHRLADQRWYVDIHNAKLTDAGRDEHPSVAAVDSVRVRQIGTPNLPVVRIAITLRGEKEVDVDAASDGLTIAATNTDAIAAARTGSGRVGSAAVADLSGLGKPQTYATPAAIVPAWKFGAPVNGSRVIVLDPGHGGDDVGTAHNGLQEKLLTIDIARRLRTLLTAAGWTVRMTRDTDIDPVSQSNLGLMKADGKPNPSDRAYLQTRCDVANDVNARLFISIHVNYSDSPAVNGTTFYWYKPEDQLLAQTLEKATIPVAGTSDDGPKHENFYVIRHTTMPAVLIETAFISNAHDATLLGTPAFLQNMAQGIANGVKAYAGAPVTQQSRADQ
jgi:N-acetylmuramoyl-L-alanine amidase